MRAIDGVGLLGQFSIGFWRRSLGEKDSVYKDEELGTFVAHRHSHRGHACAEHHFQD